jgi:uncharacterized protein (TIGR02266 family)
MSVRRDQRHSRRITINREFATIEEFVSEYVTNISRTGVFIKSRNPLPVGTKVNLRFSIVLDEIESVEGLGEVVRVVDDVPETGMGVVFSRLDSRSERLIERLVGTV